MAERGSNPSLDWKADYIEGLASHCRMASGEPATETWNRFTAQDAEELQLIANRLRRMAPHEKAIRRMVMQK